MLLNGLSIKLFNKLLETNSGSRKRLSKYAEKSFCLMIMGFNLMACIDNNGDLSQLISDNYDVSIQIPLDSATYLVMPDKLDIYKKIKFSGDIAMGRELLEILTNLHFSGLYNVSNSPFMLILINKIHSILDMLKEQVKLMYNNTTLSIKEYLLYESEDLVTQFEHDTFCNNVDDIRERTVHLEHQIARFSNK